MYKSFVFRIYPNSFQKNLLERTFGCARFVYNHFLDMQIKNYQNGGKYISYNQFSRMLTELKKEKPFLSEVDSVALQKTLKHLDDAYKNFFGEKHSGFPKFKSKRSRNRSYSSECINNNIRIEESHIRLPKLGSVKARIHRDIPESYILKSVTVKQVPSGKYYVSVLFEYENQVIVKNNGASIGLDFSMHSLFVDSNGLVCDYPRFYRKSEEKLAREQRKLSHMKKGSSNYRKQKLKIARIHEKVSNQRKDFLHKKSHELASEYAAICIEDLNMKGISKALNFGKSVHDNGWGMFTGMLEYKLADHGGSLIKIDRWFPSSQVCSTCGSIHPEVKALSVRRWFCDCCLTWHDRDENAAINIRNEGLRKLTA